MADVVFRSSAPSAPEPPTPGPEGELNTRSGEQTVEDLRPIEDPSGEVLTALGIEDLVKNLPEGDQNNLQEVSQYIIDVMKMKKLQQTASAFRDTFDSIKETLEIDPNTEPTAILERIGNLIRSWKSISFVSDPAERRQLLMKLARLKTSQEMDDMLFREMSNKQVWR